MLITSLILLASSRVYHVIPDDHHPTSDNTYTLQHCLNNTSKYFTSNVQLHFLSGQYLLSSDLVISNISNFSLVGNISDGEVRTVINCTSPAGILVIISDNILIKNFVMWNCIKNYIKYFVYPPKGKKKINLLVLVSTTVIIDHFYSFSTSSLKDCSIHFRKVFNILALSNIVSNCLTVEYVTTVVQDNHFLNANHTVEIYNYQCFTNIRSKRSLYSLQIFHGSFHNINVQISESNFYKHNAVLYTCEGCINGRSIINIVKCKFTTLGSMRSDGSVIKLDIETFSEVRGANIHVCILQCAFEHIHLNNLYVIQADGHLLEGKLSIENTSFSFIASLQSIIYVEYMNITFVGPVTFSGIKTGNSIIETYDTHLEIHNYIEISNNSVYALIDVPDIYFYEGAVLNVTLNNGSVFFTSTFYGRNILPSGLLVATTFVQSLVSQCLFQYISEHGNLDKYIIQNVTLPYKIIFHSNFAETFCDVKYRTTHCSWAPNTAFMEVYPYHVNHKVVQFNNNNFTLEGYKHVCLCDSTNSSNCQKDTLSAVYPGQTVTFQFITSVNTLSEGFLRIENRPKHACSGHSEPLLQEINNKNLLCSTIKYTVQHTGLDPCEIYVSVRSIQDSLSSSAGEFRNLLNAEVDVYYMHLRPCPNGFLLSNSGYCQCDPVLLSKLASATCDINDGTVSRPGNSWVLTNTINNSHTYQLSLKCPFDYCLPHSTRINFSNDNLQCQFSRCGVLCGQCQAGLSTVFFSSKCKGCSNFYLWIIIPIVIAGMFLVFLLFFLNLTVTDGNINGFLLYVNVISINSTILFSNKNDAVGFANEFISLANLDLGIETCFYNGMDDYAKMWLQLTFPVYIIFIATSLIMASRYSTRMQRLTAQRALPVLATLFLLSYTKILRTVCSVMFFYSTITHLPGGRNTLVWSVDANVPLFGVKFTILFTVCLLLFLILLPFNVILLFTRTLSYLKFINHFKPLLDAFQGPYKDKFYYWTGLQLSLRAVFFGLSALDRSANLMASIILVGVMISVHGYVCPFKDKTNNIIELLFLINLQITLVMSVYNTPDDITVNILIAMVAVQLTYIVLKHVYQYLQNRCSCFTDAKRKLIQYIPFRKSSMPTPTQIHQLKNIVPDVAHRFDEFQEPVIGID